MKEFNHDISLDKEKLKRKEKAFLNESQKLINWIHGLKWFNSVSRRQLYFEKNRSKAIKIYIHMKIEKWIVYLLILYNNW